MFTLNALLKQAGGFLKSKVDKEAGGARYFVVSAGGVEWTFQDDAYCTQQLKFEKELDAKMTNECGFGIRLSSYSDMGVKLGLFKKKGVSLAEGITYHMNTAVEPSGQITFDDYCKLGEADKLPSKVTGIPTRMYASFTNIGYTVGNGVASMPTPDYALAVQECYDAIYEVLYDADFEIISKGTAKLAELSIAGEAEADNQEQIRDVVLKAYGFAENNCSKEDLSKFFAIDHNGPFVGNSDQHLQQDQGQ